MSIRRRDPSESSRVRLPGSWRRVAYGAVAAASPLSVLAGPLVLEPVVTLPSPSEHFPNVSDVAIDGDSLIMTAYYHDIVDPGGDWQRGEAAFLFRREHSANWAFVRQLAQLTTGGDYAFHPRPTSVAMDDGVAAINLSGRLFVFEQNAAEWLQMPIEASHSEGDDTEIDAGTILGPESGGYWAVEAYRKNGAGVYESAHYYRGVYYYDDENAITGGGDISGPIVILPQNYSESDPAFQPTISVWEGVPPTSGPTNLAPPPNASWSVDQSSVEGSTIVVGGGDPAYGPFDGFHIYRRQSPGVWQLERSFAPPDALMSDRGSFDLQLEDGLLLQSERTTSGQDQIQVFVQTSDGSIEYVARLLGASRAHHSEGRVAGVGAEGVKIFELPNDFSQPAQRHDDFQDGDSVGWVSQPGSGYRVTSTSYSNVYRQSSLAGDALAILSDTDWTNQSIQADVKPTAFDGNDRWFGLITRYTDANNYYYVTARRSNVVQIRKIVNGSFQVLASAPLPITLNRTYRLQLEAINDLLRLYVDGNLALEVRDGSHSHGHAGLMTYKTRADYDNVIVSPTPRMMLFADRFDMHEAALWDFEGESWYVNTDVSVEPLLAQSSTSGTPKAIVGIPVADQSVQARVRPTAFGAPAQSWFGLMGRVVDSSNYYYVTVRRDNTISLRKLTDGAIHVLDTAPFNVALGRSYTLRLEAIGSRLRAYVNGALLLEAMDTTIDTGRYGLVTYSTAAEFDDLLVTQP